MYQNDSREQSFYRILAMTVSLLFLLIIVVALLGATGVYSLPYSEPVPEGEEALPGDDTYAGSAGTGTGSFGMGELGDTTGSGGGGSAAPSVTSPPSVGDDWNGGTGGEIDSGEIDSGATGSGATGSGATGSGSTAGGGAVPVFDPGEVNPAYAVSSPLETDYPEVVLPVSADAGADYLSRIIFLGDSTTYGLRRYKMLAGGRDTDRVWTPESGTLTLSQAGIAKIVYPDTGEELTIAEAVKVKMPEIMVITLGVNGVSFMPEDYFKREYVKLVEAIQKISPETEIILQSIFPVARSYAKLESINNEKINAANSWVLWVAENTGVKYLDTITVLADAEGFLPEELQNGDGMHLNESGFKIELDYIRTHALMPGE